MDPALWELLRAEAGTDGDRVLEAIIRLAHPEIEIPGVRIVSRFGAVVTARIRARDVIPVRARPDVVSIKAPRLLGPGYDPGPGSGEPASTGPTGLRAGATDIRRDPALRLTGAGVVVASVDWGVDIASDTFRWPEDGAVHAAGGTRFLSFWDQRDQARGPRPEPYGYGAVHDRADIDEALGSRDPYGQLGYHPGIADAQLTGAHGHHVLDIAAGNGQAGGPAGIAPSADLIFVHLTDASTGGLANFGDSVRLLEAVDYISRTAGRQPCVINISAGRMCGPKDGRALAEFAFDELLARTPGRFLVNSAGNYFRSRTHARGMIAAGESQSLTFVVSPDDITLNELEIWYDGADEFVIRVDPPGSTGSGWVRLGERSDLRAEGAVIGRLYHRKHDPNNGDNHFVAYLDPGGRAGEWTVTLQARRARRGRFHAWIERDDACRGCQAKFAPEDASTDTTVGAISTSHLPLVVSAINNHVDVRPPGPFSSAGPTRDLRRKPDLAAPGVLVLAGRSTPPGTAAPARALVRKSGTSMATPHVTGAVALCYEAAGGQLSAWQVRALLLDTCDAVSGTDPDGRLGRGYLNIPRLAARLQRAPELTTAPFERELAMDAEDIILLTAAPATAYREFVYRPRGELARWVARRFDLVARPQQALGSPPRAGDLLLEVAFGHLERGRCRALTPADLDVLAARGRLAPGQLLLRPRQRVTLSPPLLVEPALEPQFPDPASEPEAIDSAAEGSSSVDWRLWTDLIQHRVPSPVVAELGTRGIDLPPLGSAWGDINLDFYGVRIAKLPSMPGTQLTPEALLEYIRTNINHFVDTSNSSFPPLDPVSDGPRWLSRKPLGAVININIHALGGIDHSLVVCSHADPRRWIFTTAHNESAGYHPVTGNRMFGISAQGSEWIVFTRGADRVTQFVDRMANIVGSVWAGADGLWQSFQRKVNEFVNRNLGLATVLHPISDRWEWKPIEAALRTAPPVALSTAPSVALGTALHESDSGSEAESGDDQPLVPTPFTAVRAVLANPSGTPAVRATVLQSGIDTATGWRTDLQSLTERGKGPIPALWASVEGATGVTPDVNPMVGVSGHRVAAAYRAFAEGAVTDPWTLLALWVKEGREQPWPFANLGSTAANARALWRTRYYYCNMGLDHFTHAKPTSSDNVVELTDMAAPQHEADFAARIAEQVQAKRLPRDISAEINAELHVAPDPATPGQFYVTPAPRFFALSLLLADAFYRENLAAVEADPRIGGNADAGWAYARWNLRRMSYSAFVSSADRHRAERQYRQPDGTSPSITQWAFERHVLEGEYDEPRKNAIRFRYYLRAYRPIFEGGF